ncbi:hypothetical protein [Bradyrhizobium sp. LTSP885]|uniref:hypothetical protein n=1 Tax=Bradyrhizobium sp. LTSP885 TaxID=1619232 RepID=UPI00069C0F43|nr:hypothetical protein [Bradyrhizobium sp. LTSP885]
MSEHPHLPQDGHHAEHGGELTRRTVLAGVAATTVAAGVVGMELPAAAQAPAAIMPDDMVAFIYLSSALTGIAGDKLAPGFADPPPQPQPTDPLKMNEGSDPVSIKQTYFRWVSDPGHDNRKAFPKLLQIAKDSIGASDRDAAIIQKVSTSDDTKYLARSIVLMWYLGAWFAPDDLQTTSRDPGGAEPNFSVISPAAYTQGWALYVAQAHPMGFSRFQFGYWSHPPRDLGDFVG